MHPLGAVACTTGELVDPKEMRVVELIRAYDPNLDVEYTPTAFRNEGSPPFRIMSTDTKGERYIAFYADRLDESILARIYAADLEKVAPNKFLAGLEANEIAHKNLKIAEDQDKVAEASELAASIMSSPLHTYKHAGIKYQ